MSNDLARDFLQSVSGFTLDDDAPKSSADRPVRLATVHASYSGTGAARVTFDGESTATVKAYVVMEPVAAADRVVLLPVGQGYVILGKLGGGAWYSALVAADVAAAARLTTLEARALQGTIPGSVVLGSGSATVAADGLVTFTGASSVSLNNVFDGLGADIHEVHFFATQSGAGTVTQRLRASGTDLATATHTNVGQQNGLTAGPARSASSVSNVFGYFVPTALGAGPNVSQGRTTIFRPKISGVTYYTHESISLVNGDRYQWLESGNTPTGVDDGLSIISSAGTMTGYVKVVKRA